MKKTEEAMINKFNEIRTGVANPKILDKIMINYYGAEINLKNISNISIVEGNQINIKPFDNMSIPEIERAIFSSDLGITPTNDGKIIKLLFPKLTEEKRKNLIKQVDQLKEQTKVNIRNIRRQGNEEIKKNKFNEYLEERGLKEIQHLSDKFIKSIDNETIRKNNELLKI
nr:ribosome recycling factor [Candidatus Phytoplasma luffae]